MVIYIPFDIVCMRGILIDLNSPIVIRLQTMQAPDTHKVWRIKADHRANITYTYLRSTDEWYFDSGFSSHMTCAKSFLVNWKTYSNSYIPFGNSGKGKILGKVSLVIPIFPV